MKKKVADLLCGAGGSSTGCEEALAALGYEAELVCVNHWPTAIETHARNHPRARHYCQDIATVEPRLAVPEGYLDLLMASPSCTHHSSARGGRPTSDQQRSDPWHIVTWLTQLRVQRLIIENVWEFTNWGPVDPATGRPIPERKGEYFRAWIDTIKALGATAIEWRKLNAADYGEATTRQRFIMFVRFDGKPIVWPRPTHGAGARQAWRPARDVIDWSIPGRSIFGRKKPLSPKTLARILAGATRHNWPEPFLVILRNHMDGKSLDGPLPTIAAAGNHIGLAQPILIKQNFRRDTTSVDEPVSTIMTQARIGLVEPFVLSQASGGAARAVNEPLPTATTDGAIALISPYYGSGSGETCVTVERPLPTATAKPRFGLVLPITHSCTSNRARDVDAAPLPTLTTANRGELALVEAGAGYDILFRMLEPHELAAAMGFNDGARVYDFAGTKTEKVKQIGNAVSVKLMRACVTAMMSDAQAIEVAA
ncbi:MULTISPECIES: DNA cytosine methyltransferase [unclassified Bradyrhizobium]|uniref:DNA cytosine methyltransferase n=1 Tax=unclassified Bradyrhizobium TaxID=2631580 RepID=UPI00291702C7|nr:MULTISPECIES: DNA cytosine methyltransferase [unclassified Bradyrhizobium]